MTHVIYRTEYFNRDGSFINREEVSVDLYKLPVDDAAIECARPESWKILQSMFVESILSKELFDHLLANIPDNYYHLRYAALYNMPDGRYVIFSIYEKYGEQVELTINIFNGETIRYSNPNEQWVQLGNDYETDRIEISKSIDGHGSPWVWIGVRQFEKEKRPQACMSFGDWYLSGKLDSVEHISPIETHYLCSTPDFQFTIIVKTLGYCES